MLGIAVENNHDNPQHSARNIPNLCTKPAALSPENPSACNIGVLIIGIGFWGPLYSNYNNEPPPKKNR